MRLFDRVEKGLLTTIDGMYARLPRRRPSQGRLKNCRIVSHRGEHDGRTVLENTLAAFDAAVAQEIWGIEFDIRWTRDLTPVVIHDPDLRRVFGLGDVVSQSTLEKLKRVCPQVPTLAETVARYGGKTHLMVEIKQERYPEPNRQNRILGDLFSSLQPVRDFHLLALDPEMFRLTTFAPAAAFLPVARLNVSKFSRMAIREGFAGVAGHYVLLGAGVIRRHHAAGQMAGTGYIRSRHVFLREINRGVDWIFSNHAGQVQRLLVRLRSSAD
jgi:glycerophosphoryl diester phosphodiesterase